MSNLRESPLNQKISQLLNTCAHTSPHLVFALRVSPMEDKETNATSSLVDNFQNHLGNRVSEGGVGGAAPRHTRRHLHTSPRMQVRYPFQIQRIRHCICLLVPSWCHLFVQVWVEANQSLTSYYIPLN